MPASQLLGSSAHRHCQPGVRSRARNSTAAAVGRPLHRCRRIASSCRDAAPATSHQPSQQQHHSSPHQQQHQQQQEQLSRRRALAVALSLVPALALPAAHAAAAASTTTASSSSTTTTTTSSSSSDLVEGSQHLAEIGSRWLQSFLDGLFNQDATGVLDGADGAEHASTSSRRFGTITVPGLSSYSFVHGALVGAAVILLLAADKLTPAKQQPQEQQQQPGQGGGAGPLNPEAEAALMRLLASPQVKQEFHNAAVHAALQEVRVSGPSALQKYRGDPAVMAALSRLLEIEDILERL